jgi:predicted PurR-regulated permease PerM
VRAEAGAPVLAAVPAVVPEEPLTPLPMTDLPEAVARKADLIWAAGMVGALGFLFLLLCSTSGVAVPVLLAVAFAYVLNPVVTWLASKGLSRTLATTAVFGAVVVLIAGALLYLVPVLSAEAAKLPEFVKKGGAQLVPKIEQVTGISVPGLLRERAAELSDEAGDVLKSAGPVAAKLLARFAGNTARLIGALMGLLVVPVLGFFFLKDYPQLVARFRGLLPRKTESLISRRFAEVDAVLSAFVRGQLTLGAILACFYVTGLSVARIDLAIVIALLAGFGNLVPYLGTGTGIVLSLLSVVISWRGPWQLAVIALTFGLAQVCEGTFITPRIVGEKVGLPPVAVIIAVLAFGEMFGFVGVLLAVPTSAVLKVVLRVVVQRYRRSRLYTGEAEPV